MGNWRLAAAANVLLSGYCQCFYLRAICTESNIYTVYVKMSTLLFPHMRVWRRARCGKWGNLHFPTCTRVIICRWLTVWWDIQDIHAYVYSIRRRLARQGQRQQRREKINKCGKMKMCGRKSFLNSLCITYLYSSQRALDLMAL